MRYPNLGGGLGGGGIARYLAIREKHQAVDYTILTQMVTLEIPQGEIAATNFYDSGGSRGEKLGEILAEIFWAFSCFICCADGEFFRGPLFLVKIGPKNSTQEFGSEIRRPKFV